MTAPKPGPPTAARARGRAKRRLRPGPRPDRASPTRPDRRQRTVRHDGADDAPPRPPRSVTVRSLVLGLVVLVAFIVLAPTLRAYLTQSEQHRRVNAELAALQDTAETLESDLERWEDPAYVQAQARERLAFVMPGEVPYRVIDPQTVPAEDGSTDGFGGLEEAVQTGPAIPWYLSVWDSVQAAGEELPDEAAGSAPVRGPGTALP